MTDDKQSEEPKNKKTEKKELKLSKKVESLVDEIAKLSVMELSELVNALQEKLGVSAQAAPVMASPAPAGASSETQAAENQAQGGGGAATQTVIMTASGANKIAVIKALREINQNLGLKEAKDATEAVPYEVLKDAKSDDAKNAADKLKTAGATVELK
jgi:large subunit ribosomal protein L7/L12